MSLALWRSPLARALHRNRSLVYARYLQLATVRADGRPANRTVVFRGFLDQTNQLTFITDVRSEKSAQISSQPWGEICWYFPKTREQFRLLGSLTLVSGEDATDLESALQPARQKLWQDLSEAARIQFTWANPGAPAEDIALVQPAPDPVHPLPNFSLLLLEPEQVDHLELRGNPQNRYRYEKADQDTWIVRSINP